MAPQQGVFASWCFPARDRRPENAMNTMTMTTAASLNRELLATLKEKCARLGPLAAIVILHLVLFYMLQSGMLRKVAHAAMPEVINIAFIAPPAPLKPSPPAPLKTVQLARQAPAIVRPMPVLTRAPAEPAITVPQVEAAEAAPPLVAALPAPAAPPAPPAPAVPHTVSSVEYIRPPQPVYPAMSRRLGETGTVVLRILIGVQGQPEQVLVQKSSGSSSLDEAGRQAALRALFKPHLEDGKPVAVFVLVPLNFQLS
jgi:protein TonB